MPSLPIIATMIETVIKNLNISSATNELCDLGQRSLHILIYEMGTRVPVPAAKRISRVSNEKLYFGKQECCVKPGRYDFNDDGLGVRSSEHTGAKATSY